MINQADRVFFWVGRWEDIMLDKHMSTRQSAGNDSQQGDPQHGCELILLVFADGKPDWNHVFFSVVLGRPQSVLRHRGGSDLLEQAIYSIVLHNSRCFYVCICGFYPHVSFIIRNSHLIFCLQGHHKNSGDITKQCNI